MYDVAIIGAGPAGIFSALELTKLKPDWKIAVFEKGPKIDKRKCPAREGHKCPPCKTCNLLCGWGGAGAFSDGKLTLASEVGGNLIEYMNRSALQDLISYTDNIYLDYGATNKVHGNDSEAVSEISRRAKLAELKLIHSPIRHMGSDKSQGVLKNMYDALKDKVEVHSSDQAYSLIIEGDEVKGFTTKSGKTVNARYVIVAPGREGADWLTGEFKKFGVGLENNAVDIGVRVELPASIMEELTSKLYEVKLLYNAPTFGDDVRTFCMNPNGEVVCENYAGITTVNGHSYAEKKTEYTNFALLVSKKFTEPFKEPIAYGQHIARLANMLAGGVLVQRFGDLMTGRRSTPAKIADGTVVPTLKHAVPGDLSLVLPHRHLTSIVEMIQALDKIAPGVASRYTLLYGVEVKFYSARVKLSNELETEGVKNLFAIGDGAGVTRGLIQASASGVHAARVISSR
ncbi:MAG: FAD-dependent oxidoreductase [Candidatus Melainabacteria bacterium GWF2_37_15]|nr:MAG: FAD-dependent oxidoreductase [Candidatus Melainabacteria bacterium GWF2_37_15]